MNKKYKRKIFGKNQRLKILKRDNYKCVYCGENLKDKYFEIDHIFPKSKGGSDRMFNLAASCRKCNQEKSDNIITPKNSSRKYLLRKKLIEKIIAAVITLTITSVFYIAGVILK